MKEDLHMAPLQPSKLAIALCNAQKVIEAAAFNKEGQDGNRKFPYATLEAVWDAVRKPLTDNGLSVMQFAEYDDEKNIVIVTTELLHGESGEKRVNRLKMPVANRSAMAIGSAITYARRYSFSALIGVTSGPDDDGKEASRDNGIPAPRSGPVHGSNRPKQQTPTTREPGHAAAEAKAEAHPAPDAAPDFAPDGTPLTARAKLEVAINEATVENIDAVTKRIQEAKGKGDITATDVADLRKLFSKRAKEIATVTKS